VRLNPENEILSIVEKSKQPLIMPVVHLRSLMSLAILLPIYGGGNLIQLNHTLEKKNTVTRFPALRRPPNH